MAHEHQGGPRECKEDDKEQRLVAQERPLGRQIEVVVIQDLHSRQDVVGVRE